MLGFSAAVVSSAAAQPAPQVKFSPDVVAFGALDCRTIKGNIYSSMFYFARSEVENTCLVAEERDLILESFFRLGIIGEYRVVYTKLLNQPIEGFAILLRGGPRSYSFNTDKRFYSELVYALPSTANFGVLAPDYMGTQFRSVYPNSDLAIAATEIIQLSAAIEALHSDLSRVIVAESAGAFVALQMLKDVPVPTVLISPLVTSFDDLLTDPSGTDLESSDPEKLRSFYRYVPGTTRREKVSVPADDQIRAFAGAVYGKDLATLINELPKSRRACLAIIFGSEDKRVKIWKVPEFRAKVPDIPIRMIEGMGHGPESPEEAAVLARTVREMMPTSCK